MFICSRVSTQAVVDPDLLIIGRDQLPENGESVADTFLFFDQSKGALRYGLLTGASFWSPDSLGIGSFAAGLNTIASGRSSSVWGQNNSASGDFSTAFGRNNKASGEETTAWGNNTQARGRQSTTWGERSNATGTSATAWGNGSTAIGTFATAWGQSTQATEANSTAWGSDARATGTGSTAWGSNAAASAFNSTAWGNNTQANNSSATAFGSASVAAGSNSTAAGSRTTANGQNCFVVGMINDPLVAPNTLIDDESPLFIIGNGEASLPRIESNALVVRKNGHLEVAGSDTNNAPDITITSRDALLNLGLGQEGPHGFAFGDPDAGEGMKMLYRTVPNTLNVELGKDFGSNTNNIFELQEDGDLIIAGSLMQNSDRRFKKDITPISNVGELINQISGYTYYWKDNYRPTRKQVGLIAQEVQEVLPDLVQEDEEGMLQLDYISLIPLLVEALKEERKERENQQRKYDILEKKIINIERLIKQK